MEVRTLLPSVMAWRWQVTTNPRSWRGRISQSEMAGEEFSNLGMPGQEPPGQLCYPLLAHVPLASADPAGGALPLGGQRQAHRSGEAVTLARASHREIRMFPISSTRTAQNSAIPESWPNHRVSQFGCCGPGHSQSLFVVSPAPRHLLRCSVTIGSRSWSATQPSGSNLPGAGPQRPRPLACASVRGRPPHG
jgi:hypothetical protein